MSIEKDVENMYRNDIEKRKKNQKKKKNKKFVTLLLIVAFVAAVILLLNYLGLGFGGGKGDGGNSSSTNSGTESSKAETTTTTTEPQPKEFVNIKVAGSTYIYQENVITLENFRETVRLMSDNVVVMITDDNATQNAMDDLTAVFEADGREYAIEIPGNSQQADSSSTDSKNIVP